MEEGGSWCGFMSRGQRKKEFMSLACFINIFNLQEELVAFLSVEGTIMYFYTCAHNEFLYVFVSCVYLGVRLNQQI